MNTKSANSGGRLGWVVPCSRAIVDKTSSTEDVCDVVVLVPDDAIGYPRDWVKRFVHYKRGLDIASLLGLGGGLADELAEAIDTQISCTVGWCKLHVWNRNTRHAGIKMSAYTIPGQVALEGYLSDYLNKCLPRYVDNANDLYDWAMERSGEGEYFPDNPIIDMQGDVHIEFWKIRSGCRLPFQYNGKLLLWKPPSDWRGGWYREIDPKMDYEHALKHGRVYCVETDACGGWGPVRPLEGL
jgi:hypothetical protein